MAMYVVLTVGDHEKNGFVALAAWRFPSETAARAFMQEHDDAVEDGAEPDIKTAPFTFVLDLMAGIHDMLDNGNRNLPIQVAMKLAPDQVRRWLDERPEPDDVAGRPVPWLNAA
jgi:hypothetical protein